jgi:hypothetical protein
MLLGRDLISNLPGEVRNMIYRVVLDSLNLARVRCRTCPLVFADKGILQSCTKWFPTNRIIYQEANTLFCVEYLPNMGVFLPSMQQLSDCIQIFGDRCPRLYACMSGYMAYPSCAYMYLRGECEKQMNQVLRSDTQGIGLYTWGADAAWKWIEPVGVGEDEVSVYTCFVRSDRFASLLIRGNVGRAPWLRELLFNTEFRRKMNMSPLGVRRSARVFMKKQGMKK